MAERRKLGEDEQELEDEFKREDQIKKAFGEKPPTYTGADMKKPCPVCKGKMIHAPRKYAEYHRVRCEECGHVIFPGKTKPKIHRFKPLVPRKRK